jgi:hypothetical protein
MSHNETSLSLLERRSIDMPAGWVGTGFNRWVDDDTFDNQALIKDEQSRALLDTTQEKR